VTELPISWRNRSLREWLWDYVLPILAPVGGVLAGLAVGAIPMLLAGVEPIETYRVLFSGALGGERQIIETLLRTTPFLVMSLSLTIAFRSRVFNVGGEGQYYIGALLGTMGGLAFQDTLPAFVLVPLMMLLGAAGGALFALVPAYLKLRHKIDEIVSTLMLNYVAEFLVFYLARGPLMDRGSVLPQTAMLGANARLPLLFGTRLHIGVVLAVLLVPLIYVLFQKTTLGFQLRAVSSNPKVASYSGMNVSNITIVVFLLSGALAGLTGIFEVSSLHFRLKEGISGGYGWSAIMISLLGGLNPVGVLFASFFFAALTIGAQTMHSISGLPKELSLVIQALIVLFVLAGNAALRLAKKK
jgi:general nucleoside transport system permease protein